jgi:hypothetical protein
MNFIREYQASGKGVERLQNVSWYFVVNFTLSAILGHAVVIEEL